MPICRFQFMTRDQARIRLKRLIDAGPFHATAQQNTCRIVQIAVLLLFPHSWGRDNLCLVSDLDHWRAVVSEIYRSLP